MGTDICQPQWGSGEVWTANVVEASNYTCWPSVVWAVNKTAKCLLTWLLTVLNVLTVLTISKQNAILLISKLELVLNWAPHCLTWTKVDGNTLCSLMYTSISGTLSCQNLTGNTQDITKFVKHFI